MTTQRVYFTPPGLAHEDVTWNTTRTDDEYVAALVTLGASPFSKIEENR